MISSTAQGQARCDFCRAEWTPQLGAIPPRCPHCGCGNNELAIERLRRLRERENTKISPETQQRIVHAFKLVLRRGHRLPRGWQANLARRYGVTRQRINQLWGRAKKEQRREDRIERQDQGSHLAELRGRR